MAGNFLKTIGTFLGLPDRVDTHAYTQAELGQLGTMHTAGLQTLQNNPTQDVIFLCRGGNAVAEPKNTGAIDVKTSMLDAIGVKSPRAFTKVPANAKLLCTAFRMVARDAQTAPLNRQVTLSLRDEGSSTLYTIHGTAPE